MVQHGSWMQRLALSEQAGRVTGCRREGRQMVELKGRQQQEKGSRLQFHSCLTLMAQVLIPCWNQMHIRFFKSLQLEGS